MKNLPAIKKQSFIEKIKNVFITLFGRKEDMFNQMPQTYQKMDKSKFKQKIKFEEDFSIKKLLEIQRKLEEGGISLELASELTKNLTSEEKSNLLELYKTQINDLEESLKNYKKRILAIRKKCTNT